MSKPSVKSERRTVHYQGRVQGVGFRYTTQAIAASYAVTGYVKNMPDGRVLLVCEGEAAELDRFLEDVQTELGRYISAVQTAVEPAQGEFEEFTIRH